MGRPLDSCKFNEESVRVRFLEGVRLHGRFELAAHKAGVTPNTVRNWIASHGDEGRFFKEAWELAKILHGQEVVEQLEQEAIKGTEEPIFNKDGVRIGTKKRYETALRAMIMRRYDSDYREKTEITHKAETGVMVVPPAVNSIAAWAELVQSTKDANAAKAAEATEKRRDES